MYPRSTGRSSLTPAHQTIMAPLAAFTMATVLFVYDLSKLNNWARPIFM